MAEPARDYRNNTAPQRQPQPVRRQYEKVSRGFNPNYKKETAGSIKRAIVVLLISAVMVLGSTFIFMTEKRLSDDLDNRLLTASKVYDDAENNAKDINTKLNALITPDKVAAYAYEKNWVKIPDSAKIYASSSGENKLMTAGETDASGN